MRSWAPLVALVLAACAHPAGDHDHAAVDHPHGDAGTDAPVTPRAAVVLDPAASGALPLTTATVTHRMFEKTVRTVGVVALDETRTAHVHSKVRGFVESVQADFVGKSVSAGAPLCGIYSQTVYAAELEYVALLEQRPAPNADPVVAATEQRAWESLASAARRRLRLWDVPPSTIDQIEKTRAPIRTFTVSAPRGGVIVTKQAFVGNFVDPDAELYVISDLTKLWVLIDVYAADVPYVHVGDPVKLSIEGTAQPTEAKIGFLAPTIDETTRTLKARVEIENAAGALRPGAFVTAVLQLAMGHGLAVPESAVIHTGPRDVVFVVHGEHVMPHDVTLGPIVDGYYRVDAGLDEGDAVATGAQFLIDSESQLRATGGMSTDAGGGGGHAGHGGH